MLEVSPKLRTFAVCAALVVGTALLYSRAAGFGFLNYDDPAYVTQNLHVMAGLQWSSVVWAFTGLADYWHPLSWLGHMLDWQLFGNDATGHHWVSIAWHAANAVLVFFVLRRLAGSFWLAAFGAAFFAWHPLRVESVAWITERKDVMSGFFFLLTLLAYMDYARRRGEERSATFSYVAVLAAFACGLMSKPMLVTLPAVLLLLDFWPLRRANLHGGWRGWRGLLLEKIPFFALSIVVSILTIRMQAAKGGFVLDVPPLDRLGNAFVSVARYLGDFFWPTDLIVCYWHPGAWSMLPVSGAAALVVGITVFAWLRRDSAPWFLVGWAWMLVMFLPVIGVVQAGFQAMADRYTYLPMLGWQMACLCAVRAIAMPPSLRPVLAASGVVVLAAIAAATWKQEGYWKDSETLFSHAIAVDDRNPIAHGFLGYTLVWEGRADEAESHARKAIELDPANASALVALANLSLKRGDPAGAIGFYRTAIAANAKNYAAQAELGELLLGLGRRDEASEHIRAAGRLNPELKEQSLLAGSQELDQGNLGRALVRFQAAGILAPDDAMAHFWSGFTLARLGRADEALAELKTAGELAPDHAGTQVEMGMIQLARGDPEDALRGFQSAITLQKDLPLAQVGAARALLALGRTEEAMGRFEAAATLSPNDAEIQKAWAEALARNREFAEAVKHYTRAVELAPKDPEARAAYGYMLVLTHRPAEAIREWEEALRLKPDFPGLRGRLEALRITTGP